MKMGRWYVTLPVVALLALQVVLYVWLAPRGFDFTDESYCCLNCLYWRDEIAPMSFLGAFLELPFRLLGQSVAAIRLFTLVLQLATGAFFFREVLRYAGRLSGSPAPTPWGYVVAGMAGSLFYFGFQSTLRAPSYNLLVLVAMLVATGLLLRLLDRAVSPPSARLVAFFYGLAIGACALGKATSAALLVLLHVVFFARVNRDWRLGRLAAGADVAAWRLSGQRKCRSAVDGHAEPIPAPRGVVDYFGK